MEIESRKLLNFMAREGRTDKERKQVTENKGE